ncbi:MULTISPECIES: hypothetical protein [Halolamina]|uniref:Uncharacterized protein n=1 Tax=Halolamina pelagica TaxID=699431 RepID=A0A1I5VPQ1_9EURY|nr:MULTISPECIES: hypothetical protein [Halolamina]NHX37833.1 hypothetical protein [Halolamina sp. R1-12]SFQ09465.1 hypothetical protein SAMN05216277_11920 [Halolamina pelagica]
MATKQSQSDSRVGEFSINTQLHGHADGPEHVHVEISPVDRQTHMAIVAAGVDGRYSFDFRYTNGTVDVQKAYAEGMREPIDELPNWMDCVRERVENEMGA